MNLTRAALDNFTENVLHFLDEMPDVTTCESALAAAFNGWHRAPCRNKPVVCDLYAEFWMCRDCWEKYLRGDFDAPRTI